MYHKYKYYPHTNYFLIKWNLPHHIPCNSPVSCFLTFAVIVFTLTTNISVDAAEKKDGIPIEAFSDGLKLVAKADAASSIEKLPEVKEKWPSRRFEYSHGGNAYLFKEYAPATFRKMRETTFLVAHAEYYVR
jgi:hypothetical protein